MNETQPKFKLTKKNVPGYSFPHNTTRTFADYLHATLIPSPDTYFKEETLSRSPRNHQKNEPKNLVMGAAYNAPFNSQHKFNDSKAFHVKPDRFDEFKDFKDAQKPAPTSYQPQDSHRKKLQSHTYSSQKRFHAKRYDTEAPGPGAYRMQSNFGVYCPSDTLNLFSSDLLSKIASQKVFEEQGKRHS